jgi:hypothetical protein
LLSKRYCRATPHIVAERFDDDTIVLDLANGIYFSFTDSGGIVWEAVAAGIRPAALAAAAPAVGADALAAYLDKLVANGLLAEADGAPDEAPAELLARLAATREAADLFVFDDLADLFLADPVHDADAEMGWPVLQKSP